MAIPLRVRCFRINSGAGAPGHLDRKSYVCYSIGPGPQVSGGIVTVNTTTPIDLTGNLYVALALDADNWDGRTLATVTGTVNLLQVHTLQ